MRLKFLVFVLLNIACAQNKREVEILRNRIDSLENQLSHRSQTEYLTQSILWFQHSPEVQAMYYQGFNMAKSALNSNLKHKKYQSKKNAIVVDIDETILNNSLYQGWLYLSNIPFSDSTWTAWILDTLAEPMPGAADFLNYAANSGCEIFYVSNRNQDLHFESTLQNLKKYKLPFADDKHLLLKTIQDKNPTGKTTKERRREKIENEYNYEIMLYCGDQLADFNKAFDPQTNSRVYDSISQYSEYFGNQYIIFPNPVYCDWLNHILYSNSRIISAKEADSLRTTKIVSWERNN